MPPKSKNTQRAEAQVKALLDLQAMLINDLIELGRSGAMKAADRSLVYQILKDNNVPRVDLEAAGMQSLIDQEPVANDLPFPEQIVQEHDEEVVEAA